MILGTLIGPQVYQFSDLSSLHLFVIIFFFFSSIVSAKIVFCLWTWPGCIRGLQILDKTGGKIISPSPPQIRDRKKHGAFLRFSTVVSARNVSGCGPCQVNCIRGLHILDRIGGKCCFQYFTTVFCNFPCHCRSFNSSSCRLSLFHLSCHCFKAMLLV